LAVIARDVGSAQVDCSYVRQRRWWGYLPWQLFTLSLTGVNNDNKYHGMDGVVP